MPGVVWGNGLERLCDGLIESFGGAGFGRAQEWFEFGPGLLGGIEVGRIGRQVEPLCAESLAIVGRQLDEGENYYYFCQKE